MAADARGLSRDEIAKAPITIIRDLTTRSAVATVASYHPRHDALVAEYSERVTARGHALEVRTVTPKIPART